MEDADNFMEPTDKSREEFQIPDGTTTLSVFEYQKRIEPITDIGPGEKWVLIKVRKLSNGRGCEASNKQLGEYLGMTERTIKRHIAILMDKQYLIADNYGLRNRVLYCASF